MLTVDDELQAKELVDRKPELPEETWLLSSDDTVREFVEYRDGQVYLYR